MKRIFICKLASLLLFYCLQLASFAQGTEVAGTVLDQNGESLPGVSIAVKGTTRGTITNIDGKYAIQITEENAVLVFSFIGYTSQEITVAGQTAINVTLQEDILRLDEVVVTGYGVSKKSDLTGSLVSVKEGDMNKTGGITPEQMIQGRVSGVQIVSNNGEPGAGSQIKIRGASTIRSGQQPLYVIDGIPLDMASTSPDGIEGASLGGAPATSPLAFLNANDIESIDILKDASAAAIYGSRGANGVILITTKKGKEGISDINYSTTFSVSQLRKKLDVLSAKEWVGFMEDTLGYSDIDYGASTDWQDQIFRTALSNDHNLSISGGTSKTTYNVSLNYLNQNGIIDKSDLKRYSGRLNLSQKALNNRLTLETNLTASEVVENRVPVGATGFEGDLLLNSLQANPTWPVYNSDGTPFQTTSVTERNPVAMLEYTDDLTRTSRLLGGLSGTLEIVKGLSYKINLGLDYGNANRFINQSQKLNYMIGRKGSGQINNKELYNYLIEHTLNYTKSFGIHSLTLLAGYSYQDFKVHGNKTSGGGYATDGILYTNKIDAGLGSYTSISSYANAYKMQSYFGRVNYNLNEKYLVTATVRADGSSKFGANNKYGIFPSFAVAWRLSQEDFIKNLDIFNNLKLRIGWGRTGNSEIETKNSQYLYTADMASKAIIGGEQVIGLKISRTPNPDITWESTSSSNLGLDFGIFEGRLSGSLDLYKKTTKNLLLKIPAPPGSPTADVLKNIDSCKIINKGAEISLMGVPITRKNFSWEITANMAFLKNVVKNLPVKQYQTGSAQGQGLTGAYVQIITSDQPMNVFYGYKIDSIDPQGGVHYVQGASGLDTLLYLGDPQPKFTWSLTNTFRYKNFDLSIFIEGVHGNKIFNNTALLLDKANFNQSRNALRDLAYDDVSAEGYTPVISDRYIEDGSYVRISNVTWGYTLNFKNSWINQLRIYVSGSNLWVFTKYTGFDPDVSSSKDMNNVNSFGIDNTNYPKARAGLIGLNVTF